ncbi:hypothetical protein BC835DRAFT_1422980 [Cytidiella melzeri]|nr:hypothetical protein BC835DRAFT_1422980 [Cytidiella melzeri]
MRYFTIVAHALITVVGLAVSTPIRIVSLDAPVGTSTVAVSETNVDSSGAMRFAVSSRGTPGILSMSGGQTPHRRQVPAVPSGVELTRQESRPPAYDGVGPSPPPYVLQQPPPHVAQRPPTSSPKTTGKYKQIAKTTGKWVGGTVIVGGVAALLDWWSQHKHSNSNSTSNSNSNSTSYSDGSSSNSTLPNRLPS